ncbi:hypothetical protein DWB85_03585 [Seongchinamella sediminis]|uniref:HupE / UreJ protein n=1 Tax=Seongchinamella sediminis TaxID=2283635 RepID=A0A3L7E3T4_9GAMM|nr:HupE/UreJ family protein [Seongchinamella sediminis]RLQ23071.1 hypothetical protein DWB85_03585 [Seongchinamella sediminis]
MRQRFLAPLLLLAPGTVLAHSPMPGIGQFYGGLLHPLLVPAHLLPLVALGLLVGQRGLAAMRVAYSGFALALLVGLIIAGLKPTAPAGAETALLLLAACCGLATALRIPLPRILLAAVAALTALVIGADSGVADLNRQQTFFAMFGAGIGACLLLLVVAGLAELPRRHWQQILVRVLGSWCAASAVIVLALALR